jgi:hypothetical protein
MMARGVGCMTAPKAHERPHHQPRRLHWIYLVLVGAKKWKWKYIRVQTTRHMKDTRTLGARVTRIDTLINITLTIEDFIDCKIYLDCYMYEMKGRAAKAYYICLD